MASTLDARSKACMWNRHATSLDNHKNYHSLQSQRATSGIEEDVVGSICKLDGTKAETREDAARDAVCTSMWILPR